jgi:hypothetical protein
MPEIASGDQGLPEIIIFFKLERPPMIMEVSVEITRSPDFKQTYAIGAIGGHSPYDFRIAFYNDSPKALLEGNKNVTVMERKIETEIILSPLAAKELANWLNDHIKDYEKVFGEIKRPGAAGLGSSSPQASESKPIQGYM